MAQKTVRLIGLGALGILYAEKLQAGLQRGQFAVVADEARAARYQKNGVSCNGRPCNFVFESPAKGIPADFVVFAVKATGLARAIQDAAPFVGKDTVVFSLLNGISSEQQLGETYGQEKVLYAVAQGMDATRTGQNLVCHNEGQILVGEKSGETTLRLQQLGGILQQCGIQHRLCNDILYRQWNKLMLNVGVNQATALYETNYGGVQQPGKPRDTMIAAMREVVPVAAANGIVLGEEQVQAWLALTDTLSPQGMPSMRQDMLAHRPSEVELFSGTILQLGKAAGIDTPVNRGIYAEICRRQQSWEKE